MHLMRNENIAWVYPSRVWFYALLVAGLLASPMVFGQSYARLGFCDYCYSDASFKSAAEQNSFDHFPAMEGMDHVYMMNPATSDIRYFDIYRWYEPGDVDPRSASGKERKTGGQIRQTSYGYYHADAVPAAGNPSVESALLDGLNAAQTFAGEVSGSIDIGDIDPGDNIESAIELVGPEDSAAGGRRNALRNLMNNYYNSEWGEATIALGDLAKRFVDRILANSGLLEGAVITIVFEDGTTIQVKLESIAEGLDGGPFLMDLDVLQETAQGPGLAYVPASQGQFNGFSYTGSPGTVQDLIDLARSYGIPITGPGGGSGGDGTMECEIDGGNIECEVTWY